MEAVVWFHLTEKDIYCFTGYIAGAARNGVDGIWIGIRRIKKQWRLLSSQQIIPYSYWHSGEPSYDGDEVEISLSMAEFRWNDLSGTHINRVAICEKNIL